MLTINFIVCNKFGSFKKYLKAFRSATLAFLPFSSSIFKKGPAAGFAESNTKQAAETLQHAAQCIAANPAPATEQLQTAQSKRLFRLVDLPRAFK